VLEQPAERSAADAFVRERLARLFPGRHRFELTDERGWVRALVELPARAGESSAA